MQVERLRQEANAAGQVKEEGEKNQGWFGGWWGGGGKKDHEEGDVALEDLGKDIAVKDDSKEVRFLQSRFSSCLLVLVAVFEWISCSVVFAYTVDESAQHDNVQCSLTTLL